MAGWDIRPRISRQRPTRLRNRRGRRRGSACPLRHRVDPLSFLTSTRLRDLGSGDREVRAIHAAEIAAAAFFGMHHVRWMVALRLEGGREREHVRGTELHAKATGLAALNDD